MAYPDDTPGRPRVRWDPTINLGHVLTFVGFMVTGAAGYFDLRERIALGEARAAAMVTEVADEKARTRDALREVRDDMREVRRGVEQLLRESAPARK